MLALFLSLYLPPSPSSSPSLPLCCIRGFVRARGRACACHQCQLVKELVADKQRQRGSVIPCLPGRRERNEGREREFAGKGIGGCGQGGSREGGRREGETERPRERQRERSRKTEREVPGVCPHGDKDDIVKGSAAHSSPPSHPTSLPPPPFSAPPLPLDPL